MAAEYEIVERLKKSAGYWNNEDAPLNLERQAAMDLEAAATIVALAEALVVAESVLAQVPYEFETTNGGRIPVTKASEARNIARSALARLKGDSHAA